MSEMFQLRAEIDRFHQKRKERKSLRDSFAESAMQAIILAWSRDELIGKISGREVANEAYRFAYYMMEASELEDREPTE